jgi:hypothetical protein
MKLIIVTTIFLLVCTITNSQDFEWAKSIQGSSFVHNRGIDIDGEGNVIAGGYFSGTADIDPGEGEQALTGMDRTGFVTKLDPDGNFIWGLFINSASECRVRSVKVDDADNIYVMGTFVGTVNFNPLYGENILDSNFGQSPFIAKYNPDGELLRIWAFITIGEGLITGFDLGNGGDIYLAGSVHNSNNFGIIDLDPGAGVFNFQSPLSISRSFICKINETGGFQWAKKLDSDINSPSIYDISTNQTGEIIIAGSFNYTVDFDPGPETFNLNATSLTDSFILKLDSDGNFVWARQFSGTPGLSRRYAYSIKTDNTGRIYVSGTFQSTTDFDPGPGIFNLQPQGPNNVFICVLDDDGNFVWAKGLVTSSINESGNISEVHLDAFGSVYITANYSGTIGFLDNNEAQNIPVDHGSGFYICKLTQSGGFQWLYSTPSLFRSSVISAANEIAVAGSFNGTVDFDPGPAVFELNAPPLNWDMFIVKFSQPTLSNEFPGEKQIRVHLYPNPTKGLVFAETLASGLSIAVYNSSGIKVHETNIDSPAFTFDLSHLPAGMYLVHLVDNNGGSTTRKLMLR